RDLDDVKAEVAGLADIAIHGAGSLSEDPLDESAGGHSHVVAVTELDELRERTPGHQGERPPRELQRIDIGPHRLEHVREIPRAHGAVVWPPDFGEALMPWLGLPWVGPQVVEDPFGVDRRGSLGCDGGRHPVVSFAAAAGPAHHHYECARAGTARA